MGTVLLTRSRSGVSLTREGEVFLHFAQMSLAALQQGMTGVEQLGAAGKTRISVGVLPSVAAHVMSHVAREFDELAPNSVLRIMDGPIGYLLDRLRLGDLDLVIGRHGPPDLMQGISFTQLYEERVEFVVRTGHPLLENPDIQRIGDWPVIYPPEGAAIRSLVDRFMIAHGISNLDHRLETVSGAFGRVYTRRSDAIWIISSGVVANEMADGHLAALPFDTSTTRGPVGLMRRPDAAVSPQSQVFMIAMTNALTKLGIIAPEG